MADSGAKTSEQRDLPFSNPVQNHLQARVPGSQTQLFVLLAV